jgi:hypothetical protein
MGKIVVQLETAAWTTRAMHFACSMARQTGGEVVLLQLIEVHNIGALGHGFDTVPYGSEFYGLAHECEKIARQYGVPVALQQMEYTTRNDALAQAAEALEASVLFAPMPPSRVGLVNRFNTWSLTHQLHQCHFYSLAGSDAPNEAVPAVSMEMPRHAQA